MSLPFNPTPLIEPVDPVQAHALAKRIRPGGLFSGGFNIAASVIAIAIGAVILSVVVSMFAGVLAMVVGSMDRSGGWVGGAVGVVLPVVLFGGVVALAVFASMRSLRARRERLYRLHHFAAANGLTYLPSLDNPALPGMIFNVGSSRSASDLMRGAEPRFVEFANYRYTTGSGKNRTTHTWGYVAIKLDVPLPHIVLDALGNNGLFGSNLSASFDKDQRLSLEGDFDKYFSLFCPQGYEADALYLFTPDIMARFIDNAAALDVEIVDDWLFFYSKRPLSTTDPATWAWMFSVVGAVLDKLAQWSRWRDDRLRLDAAAPGNAGPGSAAPGSAEPSLGAPGSGSPSLGNPAQGAGAVGGGAASTSSSALPFAAPSGTIAPPPVAPLGVARPGQRLTRRTPWVTIIVAGVLVLFWLGAQTGILGLFFSR